MLIPLDASSRQRCQKLFEALNKDAVKWCSWKSNQHLQAGLDAETDLDLLFMPQDRYRVTQIMRSCGFILFKPAKHRSYPGVADYISFETSTGRVLHIHAHFLLTLGEKNAKSFIFPWNEHILNRRELQPGIEGVYVSNPADELVFLLVREAVKIRLRDKLVNQEPSQPYGSKGFRSEYDELKEKVDLAHFGDAAAGMFEGDIRTLLLSAYTKPDAENMGRLKKAADEYGYKNGWKRSSPAQTTLTMFKNEGLNYFCRIFEKLGWQQYLIPRRRLLPRQGIVVAFLGADGAGKSTVTKTIQADWQHKLDIPLIYMGIGEGQGHIAVSLAKLALSCGRLTKEFMKKNPESKETSEQGAAVDDKVKYRPNPLLAIAGALTKKSLIRKVKRLRNKGYNVICDRWPQSQDAGINDGPLLHAALNDTNPLVRFISRWEKRQYEEMNRILKPDLCLKLIASLDIALERKPENKPIKIKISEKIESIKKLQIAACQNDQILNADESLNNVLKNIRGRIFLHLLEKPARRNSLYRECLGLPGSGKTTLSRYLIESGVNKSFSEHYQKRFPGTSSRLKAFAASCVLDTPLYWKILLFIARYRLWQSPYVAHLLKAPMRKRAFLCFPDESCYISEQFFLQEIWSIMIDSKNNKNVQPWHLAPVIKGLYAGTEVQILYFVTAPALAASRIETRADGNSRFDGKPAEEIEPELEQKQAQMNSILKACHFAGLYVIEINASAKVEEISKSLENKND